MSFLAIAASAIGAALAGPKPLPSDALKLGIVNQFSTTDFHVPLDRLLALASLFTTVSLALVADNRYAGLGVQNPISYSSATHRTPTPTPTIPSLLFAPQTTPALWIAIIVCAVLAGSSTILVQCSRQSRQARSASGPGSSPPNHGDIEPARGPRPTRRGPPRPWPPTPNGENNENSARPIQVRDLLNKRSRGEPPPPPPPSNTTNGVDDKKSEPEFLLFGLIIGVLISVLIKVINRYVRSFFTEKPRRRRSILRKVDPMAALTVCTVPLVPPTLLSTCAWDQAPFFGRFLARYRRLTAGYTICASLLAALVLYVLYLGFATTRAIYDTIICFLVLMTSDYDDFDETIIDYSSDNRNGEQNENPTYKIGQDHSQSDHRGEEMGRLSLINVSKSHGSRQDLNHDSSLSRSHIIGADPFDDPFAVPYDFQDEGVSHCSTESQENKDISYSDFYGTQEEVPSVAVSDPDYDSEVACSDFYGTEEEDDLKDEQFNDAPDSDFSEDDAQLESLAESRAVGISDPLDTPQTPPRRPIPINPPGDFSMSDFLTAYQRATLHASHARFSPTRSSSPFHYGSTSSVVVLPLDLDPPQNMQSPSHNLSAQRSPGSSDHLEEMLDNFVEDNSAPWNGFEQNLSQFIYSPPFSSFSLSLSGWSIQRDEEPTVASISSSDSVF